MLKVVTVVGVCCVALAGGVHSSSPVADGATTRYVASDNGAEQTVARHVTSDDGAEQVTTRYVTSGDGNVARYRVRERLVGKELDNDAIGETTQLTGTIAIDNTGKVVAAESRFTATLTDIKSDSDRRDGYVRRRILVTDSFPTTTFVVTGVQGLPAKLPTAGSAEFKLVGNLTVKGVTRPSTWDVKATVSGDRLTGSAKTRFTFAEFQLTQPKVPIVLSVVDTITLEYDFAMTKKTP